MAIITCSECGKDISTTAEVCPHCGYRTEHGRSVTEAKGYLVWSIIAYVLIIVGGFMVAINIGEFLDRVDYLDQYEYFSDEGQRSVRQFYIGICLMVSGFVDGLIIRYKMKEIQKSGVNGFLAEHDTKRYADFFGKNVDEPQVQKQGQPQNYVPAWKRVQIEAEKEAQEKEEREREERERQKKVCQFCGEEMSEKQNFCGNCGKSRQ